MPLLLQDCVAPEIFELPPVRNALCSGAEIAEQPLKCRMIRSGVFPIAEIGNEILADLTRRIHSCFPIKQAPFSEAIERYQANGEK